MVYDEDVEIEVNEQVYLSFLRDVRNEYNDFGADDIIYKQMNLLVDDILEKWYDEGLKKVYDEYKCDEDEMIEALMDKVTKFLESRIFKEFGSMKEQEHAS